MYSKQVQSPVETIRSLGSRFRDYRMRMNMTQKEIAEITTISIPTIYKFETGSGEWRSISVVLMLQNYNDLLSCDK